MIKPDRLIKAYGRKTAVNGLTFTVRAGVVTRFLRTHGAGSPRRPARSRAWTDPPHGQRLGIAAMLSRGPGSR